MILTFPPSNLTQLIFNYFDTYQITDDWTDIINSPECLDLLDDIKEEVTADKDYYVINPAYRRCNLGFLVVNAFDIRSWLTWNVFISYQVDLKILAAWFAKQLIQKMGLCETAHYSPSEITDIQEEISSLKQLGASQTLRKLNEDLGYIKITPVICNSEGEIQHLADLYANDQL